MWENEGNKSTHACTAKQRSTHGLLAHDHEHEPRGTTDVVLAGSIRLGATSTLVVVKAATPYSRPVPPHVERQGMIILILKISNDTTQPKKNMKSQTAPWGTNLATPPTRDDGAPLSPSPPLPTRAGETLSCAHGIKASGNHILGPGGPARLR